MSTYRRLIALVGFALLSFLFLTTATASLTPLAFSKMHTTFTDQGGATGVTQWECWDDGSLAPCHPDFYGMDGDAPNNLWMVGEFGSVYRHDGAQWNQVPFLNDQYNLYDVEVLSSNSVWVVAAGLYHWDGTAWEEVDLNNRSSLALSMVSDTNGWAVGYSGEIRHWDGTDFMTVTSPISTALRDIQMLSATDGWAVGDDGVILRYNGSTWGAFTSPTTLGLTNLDMRSATEGYAIGNNVFLRWNGTAWTIAATPGDFFSVLTMVSPTEGFAAGYQGIYEWNGATWTLTYTDTAPYLQAMTSLPGGEVVAVGASSSVLRYDSGVWNPENVPQPYILNAVAASSPTNVWAVGYNETLMRYDGATWQEAPYTPLPNPVTDRLFSDIAFLNNSDGWVVGSDVILRWNGTTWQEVDDNSSVYQGYRGVAALSATDVWVVGELTGGSGSVIRHWNGTTWSDVAHPTAYTLNTITMLNSTTGMAGGYRYDSTSGTYQSVLLRWNGSVWSEVTTPNINQISSIVLEDSNNGWVVSYGGGLRFENGVFTLNTAIYGNSAAFSNPDNGWIVGSYGHRWDGTVWHYDQYFAQYANDLLLFDDGTGWAVGDNGVIYYFEPPVTTYLPLIQRGE